MRVTIARAGTYHVQVSGHGIIEGGTRQLYFTVNGSVHEPSRTLARAAVHDTIATSLILRLEEGDSIDVPAVSKFQIDLIDR